MNPNNFWWNRKTPLQCQRCNVWGLQCWMGGGLEFVRFHQKNLGVHFGLKKLSWANWHLFHMTWHGVFWYTLSNIYPFVHFIQTFSLIFSHQIFFLSKDCFPPSSSLLLSSQRRSSAQRNSQGNLENDVQTGICATDGRVLSTILDSCAARQLTGKYSLIEATSRGPSAKFLNLTKMPKYYIVQAISFINRPYVNYKGTHCPST